MADSPALKIAKLERKFAFEDFLIIFAKTNS